MIMPPAGLTLSLMMRHKTRFKVQGCGYFCVL
jgi:hypothetical protein